MCLCVGIACFAVFRWLAALALRWSHCIKKLHCLRHKVMYLRCTLAFSAASCSAVNISPIIDCVHNALDKKRDKYRVFCPREWLKHNGGKWCDLFTFIPSIKNKGFDFWRRKHALSPRYIKSYVGNALCMKQACRGHATSCWRGQPAESAECQVLLCCLIYFLFKVRRAAMLREAAIDVAVVSRPVPPAVLSGAVPVQLAYSCQGSCLN